MKKIIMTGNEAVARGAWEAGVSIAAAYPGTPSTEILETLANYSNDIYCTWASNEKVAMEISSGASIGGARSMCSMKHVGLNVAADPLCSMGYVGVTGGLVIISADDPGCHSSQNEQDNRYYAQLAKLAMIEPSDSQECKDFLDFAYDLSENYDIPVLFRMTTRVCHSKGLVSLGIRKPAEIRHYTANPSKNAVIPAMAKKRHPDREKSLRELEEFANDCPLNTAEYNSGESIGIITSGVSYLYAKEAFGKSASFLKLGLTHPLPSRLINEFCSKFEKIYVIEEGEPYLERAVNALGYIVFGKDTLPICGEFNTEIIRRAYNLPTPREFLESQIQPPPRPPVMCAGCPHRGFYHVLGKRRDKLVAVGDIGCYSLGLNPPHNGFELSVCMGGGFSLPIGFSRARALAGDHRKVFGILGDSTFFHSGITGLIDIVATNSNVCACILDNSITAMTGHQQNPGTNKNIMGGDIKPIDILKLVEGIGISSERIRVVDPIDQEAMLQAVDDAIAVEGPFVIIAKRPCVLLKEAIKANAGKKCKVVSEKCVGCKRCLKIACPAMAFENKKSVIMDVAACTGCGLCAQQCKVGAIEKVGE